jgi:hypothetical protein
VPAARSQDDRMQKPPRIARCLAVLVVATGSFPPLPPRAAGGEILDKVFRGMSRAAEDRHARGPATKVDCRVEQLAGEIDWLEKYIDRYGSIVAKHPDVWGQSRLTRHRVEYEKLLVAELGNFKDLNNASLRRSDQSFLGMALAVQAAASPRASIPSSGATTTVMNMISTGAAPAEAIPFTRNDPFAATKDSFATFGLADGNAIGLEPTIHLDHLDRYVKHLQELRRINEGDDNGDSPGYALNLVRIPVSVLPGQFTQRGHGAEITVTADLQLGDDLLPTTFRNLVINDLVDTIAPSLTFAANDPETREAAWTEVNRQAVQREVSRLQASLEAAQHAVDDAAGVIAVLEREEAEARKTCAEKQGKLTEEVQKLVQSKRDDKHGGVTKALGRLSTAAPASARAGDASDRASPSDAPSDGDVEALAAALVEKVLATPGHRGGAADAGDAAPHERRRTLAGDDMSGIVGMSGILDTIRDDFSTDIQAWNQANTRADQKRRQIESEGRKATNLAAAYRAHGAALRRVANAAKSVRSLRAKLASASPAAIPSTTSRRSRLPIPPSQFVDVGGVQQVSLLVTRTYEALSDHPANRPCIDYNDVRGYLGEELQAAYDLLSQPLFQPLWSDLAGWSIPELVRTRQINKLEAVRCAFLGQLGFEDALPGGSGADAGPPCCDDEGPCCNKTECHRVCRTVTGALAWMILVESALLNERLIEDMQTAASSQGRLTAPGGAWSGPFSGPNPTPEARRSFNDYVRLRWPIRIFALDPVAQEQNIEDMYSKQRELQIAMAVAANGGRLNSQAALRYARRLETDMATIALNKTAVAFSHGSDTFGWRFYPRFQSPPTRNNIAAFADTLIGSNSQKRDLADRRLEPGIRECTAIVVMPSFVPYVTFDVRTNWFSLNHPQQTDQNMRRTLELSRSIKAMQNSAAHCAQCAGLYRDGEVARLLRRVDQLDRELPLQSMLTQIPYENTSGGFELFNTGVTDLAPELVGWYGAPGVDPDGPTTLFLVGKGFSVLDTKIIAGGKLTTDVELMSRQVVKVVIPPGTRPIRTPSAENCCPPPEGVPCPTPAPAASGDAAFRGRRFPAPLRASAAVPRPRSGRVVQVGNTAAVPGSSDQSAEPISVPMLQGPISGGSAVSMPLPAPLTIGGGRHAPTEAAACPQPSADCMVDAAGGLEGEPAPGCGRDCALMEYVDVHIATPYGVSSHLLVPMVTTPRENVPAQAHDLSFAENQSIRTFFTKSSGKEPRATLDDFFFVNPDLIRIQVPKTFIPPAKATLRLTLKEKGVGDSEHAVTVAGFSVPAPAFNAASRCYEIGGEELRNLVGDTSRPATDKTLRGGLKPYLDYLLATVEGDPLPDGVPKLFHLSAELVADGYVVPIDGGIEVEATPIARE